ncbi:xylose isomerase [Kribbella sp. ALI-6-A]|uniref:sugar phosphate isomerase/epimerase family protein n=1 Tax=Kribbella sp. ALI-6-A TaxID=1933817 RepID=UPI00097C85FE|nr:sugar phosphate isomerase/epimerase [Kribbella sp. ALI-6-A]ONI78538.1 xylose isomerase [Kribbella sp. ALI-6-A]
MWTLSGFADEIDDDLETQCLLLGQLGLRYLEFRSAWGINVLDLADRELHEAEAILAAHDLQVSSIGSPIGKISITEPFEPHLERMRRALDVAELLRAPYLRLFSFFLPAGDDPARHRDEVLRRMAALTAEVGDRPVTLLHENEKLIYGDVPSRCLEIVEAVDSDSLRLTWDAANFVQCGVRPHSAGYQLLRPYLEYIQVKDAVLGTGEVVPAGEGDGEVAETLRALHADGFDGIFSLEPHLQQAGALGGFSGADQFARAHTAFVGLLHHEGIEYA